MEDRLAHRRGGGGGEGGAPGGQLVEHGSQGEEVGARVERQAQELLGGHVGQRAHGDAHLRQGVLRRRRGVARVAGLGSRHELREAEIEDLDLTARGQEEVPRLDVPVDDPLDVSRVERVRDLGPELRHPLRGQRGLPEELLEGRPLEQLEHEEGLVLVGPDVVEDADVGVVQAGDGRRLALEPLHGARGAGARGMEELEGDLAPEARVARPVDDAHAAAPQAARHLVVRDNSAFPIGHDVLTRPGNLGQFALRCRRPRAGLRVQSVVGRFAVVRWTLGIVPQGRGRDQGRGRARRATSSSVPRGGAYGRSRNR